MTPEAQTPLMSPHMKLKLANPLSKGSADQTWILNLSLFHAGVHRLVLEQINSHKHPTVKGPCPDTPAFTEKLRQGTSMWQNRCEHPLTELTLSEKRNLKNNPDLQSKLLPKSGAGRKWASRTIATVFHCWQVYSLSECACPFLCVFNLKLGHLRLIAITE